MIDYLKLDKQLCFPLYVASKEVIKKYRPYLDKLNLTYTQYIVMMALWQEDKQSVKQLGDKLFLDSGTLTPLLKALESKGYINRYINEDDERVLIVELTKKGNNLKEKAKDVPLKVAACLKLNKNDSKDLYILLYKLLNNLKENND